METTNELLRSVQAKLKASVAPADNSSADQPSPPPRLETVVRATDVNAEDMATDLCKALDLKWSKKLSLSVGSSSMSGCIYCWRQQQKNTCEAPVCLSQVPEVD